MTNRLTVASAKGGVGKTTVAINLAGALNHRDHDVLLVDMDPQGVATEGLGHAEAYDAEPPTLADTLLAGDRRHLAQDLLLDHPEMDLLPSNVDLLNTERDLTLSDVAADLQARGVDATSVIQSGTLLEDSCLDEDLPHARYQLDKVLREVEDDYDYVIVDSPPYYGEILDNCLYAAPNVVIPALAEGTSQRAVELLYDELDAMERETDVRCIPALAVANRIRASTNEAKEMLEWFDAAFAETPLIEIRERVALQYSFNAGRTLFEYEPGNDMTDRFTDAAKYVEDFFNE
ncbi:putative plasmid partitioning protein Soj (plasmid) [Haloarcula marismortui ATCC 43049]|uniref:Plasmid partitioning protein Soj n=1 Tax=Haloarcula marismortui (strain ATCC 43049 / DSM 3752 / JCM 8966 / VKM B-1809) TaxID=272569 RepID=Q5V801_HALMA|nr:ParA family protein [Haloarcula marismortui]AAV44362.1 putative plasmid partitioning protein Soj [Haloarcula marismortui ATCC 43049]